MSKTIRISNGDWNVDSCGRFNYIGSNITGSTGREKCAQDVANVILQYYNSELSWGSFLSFNKESVVVLDTVEHHKLHIHSEVSDAIDRLISKQELDQDIPNDEKIARYNVVVSKSDEVLKYYYLLSVETVASKTPITIPFEIALGHKRDPNLNLDVLLKSLENV